MQVIGHRGAAALAPENTQDSFDYALSLGVDAIETDIRATSDGKFILIHDKSLDRTTNGRVQSKAVAAMPMRLRVGIAPCCTKPFSSKKKRGEAIASQKSDR